MSEPLSSTSREDFTHGWAAAAWEATIGIDSKKRHAIRMALAAFNDRVAELEKERDEREKLIALLRQWKDDHASGADQEHERADRAEAGLAAAQEALKASVGFWIATPDDLLEAPLSPAEHERLILVRDALARGGGQQDTG